MLNAIDAILEADHRRATRKTPTLTELKAMCERYLGAPEGFFASICALDTPIGDYGSGRIFELTIEGTDVVTAAFFDSRLTRVVKVHAFDGSERPCANVVRDLADYALLV